MCLPTTAQTGPRVFRIDGPESNNYVPASIDLTAFLPTITSIRFITAPVHNGDKRFVDDVVLSAIGSSYGTRTNARQEILIHWLTEICLAWSLPGDNIALAPTTRSLSPSKLTSSVQVPKPRSPIRQKPRATSRHPATGSVTDPLLISTIGNFVFDDTNGDGIQDGGEPGVAGVAMSLSDSAGNPIATTTTDGSGVYSFTGLPPGDYIVGLTSPAGFNPHIARIRAGTIQQTPISTPEPELPPYFTVGLAETVDMIDGGLVGLGSIGNFVWSDSNANGIQDAGEPGVGGVTVNLLSGAGANAGDNHNRRKRQLLLHWFAARRLHHRSCDSLRDGSAHLQDVGGDDAIDSDISVVTGRTAHINLQSGEDDTSQDAGVFAPAVISDFAWHDLNFNGVQDAGEPGMANITVNLLDSGGTPITNSND